MNDEEILAALNASGDCTSCDGSGRQPGTSDDRGRSDACYSCGGSGNDPRAMLRAVQAVGHLLVDVRDGLAAKEGE